MNRPFFICISSIMVMLGFQTAGNSADNPTINEEIDQLVLNLIETYNTPGVAISVVKGSAVIHAKGYGKRIFTAEEKVDDGTFFRIASASKAFTVTSLATLVDDGKLQWDDKVVTYLPNFQMSDPWVTREFTIRDLLTHRSGLGPGAGDLMLWPAPAGFSRKEIIHNLRYLKPVSSFRSEYAYDNLLYIVAGEIIAKVTGTPWEEYVQTRILTPLNNNCYAAAPSSLTNVATPHQIISGQISTVPRNAVTGESPVYAAAGGISCNITGLTDWMQTWLSGGITPSGQRLFSETQRDEMWKGVTIIKPSKFERELMGAHFKTYALGWRKIDVRGYEFISHTGALSGARAWVGMIPELELGIAIVDNGSNSKVRNTLMTALLSKFTGQPEQAWVDYIENWYQQQLRNSAKEDTLPSGSGTSFLPLSEYEATYKDNWFGLVDIKLQDQVLRFTSHKSKHMVGTLEPYNGNTFIVRWDDRSFEADAWVKFDDDFLGKIKGMRMKAVSDYADSSFDFHDLHFVRQNK